jgi:hypothetical protein
MGIAAEFTGRSQAGGTQLSRIRARPLGLGVISLRQLELENPIQGFF